MPSRIPVRIAEHNFRSINQARIYYRDILHKYQPGQAVSQDDGQLVSELLASSGAKLAAGRPLGVRVVQGNYGRRCFASVVNDKDVQIISIMRSVKRCMSDPVADPTDRVARDCLEEIPGRH